MDFTAVQSVTGDEVKKTKSKNHKIANISKTVRRTKKIMDTFFVDLES